MTIKLFFKFLKIFKVKKIIFNVTIITFKDKKIIVFEKINIFNIDKIDN